MQEKIKGFGRERRENEFGRKKECRDYLKCKI